MCLNLCGKTNSADVDECLTNNAGCHHTCINNLGSYTCDCAVGYYLGDDDHQCHGKPCWLAGRQRVLCVDLKLSRLVCSEVDGREINSRTMAGESLGILTYTVHVHVCTCTCTCTLYSTNLIILIIRTPWLSEHFTLVMYKWVCY